MPAEFFYPNGADFWTPAAPLLARSPYAGSPEALASLFEGVGVFHAVARMKPGVTLAEARGDVGRAWRSIDEAAGRSNSSRTVAATPLLDHVFGTARQALPVLMGAVLLVLFAACSGGHLDLLLGTTGDSGNPSASDPVLRESSRVAAVVANYPGTDLARLAMQLPFLNITAAEAAEFPPIRFVSPRSAPSLISRHRRLTRGCLSLAEHRADAEQMHAPKASSTMGERKGVPLMAAAGRLRSRLAVILREAPILVLP